MAGISVWTLEYHRRTLSKPAKVVPQVDRGIGRHAAVTLCPHHAYSFLIAHLSQKGAPQFFVHYTSLSLPRSLALRSRSNPPMRCLLSVFLDRARLIQGGKSAAAVTDDPEHPALRLLVVQLQPKAHDAGRQRRRRSKRRGHRESLLRQARRDPPLVHAGVQLQHWKGI